MFIFKFNGILLSTSRTTENTKMKSFIWFEVFMKRFDIVPVCLEQNSIEKSIPMNITHFGWTHRTELYKTDKCDVYYTYWLSKILTAHYYRQTIIIIVIISRRCRKFHLSK